MWWGGSQSRNSGILGMVFRPQKLAHAQFQKSSSRALDQGFRSSWPWWVRLSRIRDGVKTERVIAAS